MEIKAIITGATGMVGEGVLHECLLHPNVTEVVVISRRACSVKHPKLKEIIHDNFFDFSSIEDQLTGYNAGFFCLGVTSIGKKEEEYRRLTYDITMALAKTLAKLNPDMTISYVSGSGTDSDEEGGRMWARVKGKTENDLMELPFHNAFMFRPAYIQPTKGLKNAYKIYSLFAPLYPVWKALFPLYVCTLKEIGLAMINTVRIGYNEHILEVEDIILLADS